MLDLRSLACALRVADVVQHDEAVRASVPKVFVETKDPFLAFVVLG
jgi:hypothetical protein